jgi:hypothetical protein
MEIELRPILLMSEHPSNKPALSWLQFQTSGQILRNQIHLARSLISSVFSLFQSYRTLGEAVLRPR